MNEPILKKTGKVIGSALLLLTIIFSSHTFAGGVTASDDYFADSWEVLLIGLPDGDVTLIFTFSRENGELKGMVAGEDGTGETQFERIVERDESITVYWTAEGHYINVDLRKEDENHMAGMLMGMFNASASRMVK
jgi:hypothetical protein